ncbi:MAG: hypothetical protein IJ635_03085 [Bacteroidaceae bacterium]|nr:hypothetical protein [Bacteroidaceae bacterium]MBR1520202.1 hypothetical protein [Bacteroidaceae bacterium]
MSIPYRKRKKKVIGPDHQLHEAWMMEQFSYPPIKFEDFVKECTESQGVSGAQVKGIASAMSNRLKFYLAMGHSVQIEGIGTLKPVFSAATADAPEKLSSENVRQVKVQFYPHKDFQKMLQKMEFVDMDALNEEGEES